MIGKGDRSIGLAPPPAPRPKEDVDRSIRIRGEPMTGRRRRTWTGEMGRIDREEAVLDA